MKIFYSNMGSAKGLEQYYPKPIDVLISYYGLKKLERPVFCQDLFLDSGAFSAYRQGVSIDPVQYADFVLKNKTGLFVYANLDVIRDAKGTWKNQLLLERKGLTPLPTFHYGEPIKWLELYRDRYDYIALGGAVDLDDQTQQRFLDMSFSVIEHKSHPPKVHGFGIQDERLLRRFPWFSVDASSVHMQARYGGIRSPWGWLKINPTVNFGDTRWHTPLQLEQVKEYVQRFELPLSFEEAQQQTSVGTLMRCAISIAYYDNEFGESYEFKSSRSSHSGFGL